MEEGYDLACEASALIMQGAIDQAMNEYNQEKERIKRRQKAIACTYGSFI
mgnify:CR=1 FL=1